MVGSNFSVLSYFGEVHHVSWKLVVPYGNNFQVLSLPKKPQSDSEEEEEEKVGDGKRQTSLFSFFKRKPKSPERVCNKNQEPESVSLDVSVLKAVAEAEVSEVKTETFS